MWAIAPRPEAEDSASSVPIEEFRVAVSTRFPGLVVRDAVSSFARAYVSQDGFDFTLPVRPGALGIKAAPCRAELIRLIRMYRELVPVETPLVLVNYEGDMSLIPLTSSTTDEELFEAVGVEDW
jgi:hypothetical protein